MQQQSILEHCSDLRSWSRRVGPRSRCLMPFEVISFPVGCDFTKYLLSNNTTLPSDPRLHPGGDANWVTSSSARKDFEDDTVMERLAGWDEKYKTVFPSQSSSSSHSDSRPEKTTDAGTSATSPTASSLLLPSFSDIVDKVQVAMSRLKATRLSMEDGVCVVGAFSTADDAGWAVASNTPSCTSLADVFTTLTTSTKFGRDLRMQISAVAAASASPRPQQQGQQDGAHDVYFALRPWININPSAEFRVFVDSGKILGICQRHMDLLFPHLFPFAVPLLGCDAEQHDDKHDDEDDEVDVDGAIRWAREIHDLVVQNVVAPLRAMFDPPAPLPSLVVDVVHEGPQDVNRLPMYILGVRAVTSLEPIMKASRYEEATTTITSHSLPEEQEQRENGDSSNLDHSVNDAEASSRYRLASRIVAVKEEEVFRVFSSLASLREWSAAVDAFFQKKREESKKKSDDEENDDQRSASLVRIATSSDELSMDARAAHRGAAPLEFSSPELYNGVMEHIHQQQQGGMPREILERIVAARAAVHGSEDLTN